MNNNIKIEEISNIKQWVAAGYDGRNHKILISEAHLNLDFDIRGNHGAVVGAIPSKYLKSHIEYYDTTTQKDFANMLKYAIDNHFDFINTSFRMKIRKSLPSYILIKKYLKILHDRGTFIFNSIGNTGDTNIGDNAKIAKYIINVGACAVDGKRELYSSYMMDVLDCMALTGFHFDKHGYAVGTSFSSPFAMTIASAYKTKYPCATIEDFTKACTMDIGANGYDEFTGWGLLFLHDLNDTEMSVDMIRPDGKLTNVHKDYVDAYLSFNYKLV